MSELGVVLDEPLVHEAHRFHRAAPDEKELMKKFESLDFRKFDSNIYRRYIGSSSKKEALKRTFGKWMISMIIGFLVGILALGVRYVVEEINHMKYEASQHVIDHSGSFAGFLVYYGMNMAFATIAFFFVYLYQHNTSSSGIPEVMGYLNGVKIPHAFNIRTFGAKLSSLIFSYASSLALGPEGPMIHFGALIGASVGPAKSKTLRHYVKPVWQYRNDKDKRDFITSGAAAGISAAFGSPMGGTLFALEEAASFWSRELGWRTFFCCMVSTFTVNGILQAAEGSQNVGDYGILSFGFSTEYLYSYVELIPFALLGVLGGLVGMLFVRINISINHWRIHFFADKNKMWRLAEVLLVVTFTSMVCFGFSINYPCRALDNIKPAPNSTVCTAESDVHFKHMHCDGDVEYNEMASLLWTPPNEALSLLYHRDKQMFTFLSLGIFTVTYFLFAVVTAGLWVAGGLFIPMMLIGASLGRFVGEIVDLISAGADVDTSIYALVGSAAVMTGFCRMTISLVVILVELTEGTQYLLPIILVVMLSKWTGDFFNESLYEHLMELKGIPYLHNQPPKEFQLLKVDDVMKRRVVTVMDIERVRDIVELLKSFPHHGFPVVDSNNHTFCGMILRKHLAFLLNRKMFCRSSAGDRYFDGATDISYQEFADVTARADPRVDLSRFSEAELDMYVDLRSYMDNSVITVMDSFSYVDAYNIFRTMGLRHLPVLGENHHVVGIITRKDLL